VIDSTGVLELVGFLEDTFDVRILDDELVPENLDTIDNIVRFVNGKRTAESAA
jgi:acyl carrier protein